VFLGHQSSTFHLDYGGRDLPSTPSDNLGKLI